MRTLRTTLAATTLATLALVAAAAPASADRRAFTHTYEYMTMPRGDLELEIYNTTETATFDTDSPTEIEWQVETEYGITDHWDVSLYQVFSGGEDGMGGSSLGYSETKLRTRYRFAERGEWPVDLLLYGEIIKPFGVAGLGFEGKVILARDFGPVTVALNLIFELEAEEEAAPGGEVEVEYHPEPELALGVTYEIDPRFKLGFETWGNPEAFSEDEYQFWIGPALSWAPSPKLWITTTAGFGLIDAGNDFNFRILLGVSL
jgi:hypothetical protein